MWFVCCVLRANVTKQVEGIDVNGCVIMANPPTYAESERRNRPTTSVAVQG